MVQRSFLLILGVFLFHCGRRELPPSPDRWSPKVREILAVDRNHLEIVFSEQMSKESAEDVSHYELTYGAEDDLSVQSALLDKDGKTLHLTTENQEELEYFIEITGVVDASGNEVKGGRKKFKGNSTRDAISPILLSLSPTPGRTGFPQDSAISLLFSESMDTLGVQEALILLPTVPHQFEWKPSLAELRIHEDGGFLEGRVYRIYVTLGCRDVSGNPIKMPNSSYFTSDDSLPRGSVSGKIGFENPKGTLVGLLDENNSLISMEVVKEEDGVFQLKPFHDGTYLMVGWKEEEDSVYSGKLGPFVLEEENSLEGVFLLLKPGEEEKAAILRKYYSLVKIE